MDLSEFSLRRAFFEIRFAEAFILWDRSGKIWREASEKWPELKNLETSPNRMLFRMKNRFELALELDKVIIRDYKPSSTLKEFMEVSDDFEKIIRSVLEMTDYERIGIRVHYLKKYSDREEASKALLVAKKMNEPEGKHFNFEGKVLSPEVSFRWEGSSIGVTMKASIMAETVTYSPPIELESTEPVKIKRNGIIYDVDYHTLKPIGVDQLSVRDWLEQAFKLIKRDSKIFLER